MSHGDRAEQKGHHREWWSRRPLAGHSTGGRFNSWWKRYLHKIERQISKRLTKKEACNE